MTRNVFVYAEAADSSLENADDLLNLAEVALDRGVPGHARSLAIMANEETAKAYVYWLISERLVPPDDGEIRRLILDHREKNAMMIAFYAMSTLATHLQMGLLSPEEMLKVVATTSERKRRRLTDQFGREMMRGAEEIECRRQRGLYVDVRPIAGKLRVSRPKKHSKKRARTSIDTIRDIWELIASLIRLCKDSEQIHQYVVEGIREAFREEEEETAKAGR